MRKSVKADQRYHHKYYMMHHRKYLLRQQEFRKYHHAEYLKRSRDSYRRKRDQKIETQRQMTLYLTKQSNANFGKN